MYAHSILAAGAVLALVSRSHCLPTAEQTVLQAAEQPLSRLPVPNSTKSFWTHSETDANPLADEGSTGPLVTSADVCIIGSGISGVGVAYHLSQLLLSHSSPLASYSDGRASKGLVRTVIFEARDFCSGATGRNGGHLTPYSFHNFAHTESAFGTPEAIRAVDIENHVAQTLAEIVHTYGWDEDVDLVEGGRVSMAIDESEMQRARKDYAAAAEANVNLSSIEWLTETEMEQRYGTSYPGWRAPGANVWPLKLVTKLFKLAKASPALDLSLHTRTPVTAVEAGAHGDWVLQTPRGKTSCGKVVHATNAYTRHLLPALDITPVRGQVIATRALPSANLTTNAFLLEGMYWFPRPEDDGEGTLIIIGAGHTEGTYDDSIIDKSIGEDLREFLPVVFPGKFEEGEEPEMEWTGIMGMTPSEDPYVGPVDNAPGQFVLAGFSGHGMPRAFGCADAVARMVKSALDGSGEWDVPAWLPQHYLTSKQGTRGL